MESKEDLTLMLCLAFVVSVLWRGLALTVLWNSILMHVLDGVHSIGFLKGCLFIILFDLAFNMKTYIKNFKD